MSDGDVARGGLGDSGWARLLAALIVVLVAASLLSYALAVAIGGPLSINPLHAMLSAASRIAVPGTRADSWDPMVHALALSRVSGTALYDVLFFGLHEKFQYPPTSLLWLEAIRLFLPITASTLNRINAVVFALNAVACVLLFSGLRSRIAARAAAARRGAVWPLLAVFALPYVFWPTLYGLYVGQIQIWIDLMFTLALLCWLHDWRLGCGVLAGLACTIKPQLGLLLIWGLVWRERDFVIGFAGVLAVAGIASLARYGIADHFNYLDVLGFMSRHGESFHPNQSVNGLLNRFMFLGNNLLWEQNTFAPYDAAIYAATLLTSAGFIALPLLLAWQRRPAGLLDFCLAALCFTMGSPIAWEHHYGIALPIFIVLFVLATGRAPAPGRAALLVVLWLCWILIGSDLQVLDVFSGGHLNLLQSHVFFGGLLLLGVLAVMGRGQLATGMRRPGAASRPSGDQPAPLRLA